MRRRVLLLGAALVIAALGTALVFFYAKQAQDSALAGQEPVEVLVATSGISAGSTGLAVSESGSVELRTLPAAAVPPGALSDLTPVLDLVTVGSIFPGQVLLRPMFGTEVPVAAGLPLPEGTMAVSVQLDDPQRVAGFVQPGSEVAVFVTTATAAGGAAPTTSTALLLERVPVVAVGSSTTGGTAPPSGGSTTARTPTAILTLALTQEQAQEVILSTSSAPMHFALLDKESKVDDQAPSTTIDGLLD